jgi:hypothetical protein
MSDVSDSAQKTAASRVLIPRHLRMAWIDVMALDKAVSPMDQKIASIIGAHLNSETGEAKPGQPRLAELAGVSRQTVALAISRLEKLGYLEVVRCELGIRRSDGRRIAGGRAPNAYRLSFDQSHLASLAPDALREHCIRQLIKGNPAGPTLQAQLHPTLQAQLHPTLQAQLHPGCKSADKGVQAQLHRTLVTSGSSNQKNPSRASAREAEGWEQHETSFKKRLGEKADIKFQTYFAKTRLVLGNPNIVEAKTPFWKKQILEGFRSPLSAEFGSDFEVRVMAAA